MALSIAPFRGLKTVLWIALHFDVFRKSVELLYAPKVPLFGRLLRGEPSLERVFCFFFGEESRSE